MRKASITGFFRASTLYHINVLICLRALILIQSYTIHGDDLVGLARAELSAAFRYLRFKFEQRYPRRQLLLHLIQCFEERRRAEQADEGVRYLLPGGDGKTSFLHHAGNLSPPVQEGAAHLRAEYLEEALSAGVCLIVRLCLSVILSPLSLVYFSP